MSETQPNYIEVDLSEEQLPFEEKIVLCEEKLDIAIDDYKHGVFPKEENVTDAFLERKIENLENEYIKFVCEASDQEYDWWMNETVDRLLCGCLANKDNDNPEISEKLMETFELYREAKIARKKCKKDSSKDKFEM